MLDCLSYINKLLGESVSQGVSAFDTVLSGGVRQIVPNLAEKKKKPNGMLSLPKMTVSLLAKKLENYCLACEPDLIVCTHVFAAQLCNGIYRVQGSHNRNYNGFCVHPFWEDTKMDYYVTASELLENQVRKRWETTLTFCPSEYRLTKNFRIPFSNRRQERLLV